LKRENSLYAGVSISEAHLQQLPEDRVPHKIMDVIKHSEDLGSLEKECDGYVAKDDNCYETEGKSNMNLV